jgi:hypothetical protein
MSTCKRRSVLSMLAAALPFGLVARANAAPRPTLALGFRPFEEAVRAAFANSDATTPHAAPHPTAPIPCRRIEVGDSELVRTGVQGCHNVRPFAGFPAGHLRIVRTASHPGPSSGGVRLYVSTVDVALTRGLHPDVPSRPLDFSTLPPAPTLG